MSSFEHFRALLEPRLPGLLPVDSRAVTLEINEWQVVIRVYLHGSIAEAPYDDLDVSLRSLVDGVPPRQPESWCLLLELARRDRPGDLDVFGTPIWVENATTIATVDLRPVT